MTGKMPPVNIRIPYANTVKDYAIECWNDEWGMYAKMPSDYHKTLDSFMAWIERTDCDECRKLFDVDVIFCRNVRHMKAEIGKFTQMFKFMVETMGW